MPEPGLTAKARTGLTNRNEYDMRKATFDVSPERFEEILDGLANPVIHRDGDAHQTVTVGGVTWRTELVTR